MGYFDTFMDSARAAARSVLGDGFGRGLKFDETLVAKSAAYNRVGGVARDALSTGVSSNAISREIADGYRKKIDAGDEQVFGEILNDVGVSLQNSDSKAAQDIANRLNEAVSGYDTARNTDTISAYAEFLGRKDKPIGIVNSASGYFLDKEHGMNRIKTAAVAGVGVGVAGRVLSGGTLSHKNTGERDIAGIPFI